MIFDFFILFHFIFIFILFFLFYCMIFPDSSSKFSKGFSGIKKQKRRIMKWHDRPVVVVIFVYFATKASAQTFDGSRCRCICPDPTSVDETKNRTFQDRRVYIKNVKAAECKCENVVVKILKEQDSKFPDDLGDKFCLRCQCAFQMRHTTMIQVVVIVVLTITSGLIFYMIWLYCLKCFIRGHRRPTSKLSVYERQVDETDESNRGSDRSSETLVIFVICVISLLVVYMGFLLCLDPMMKQPRKDHPYERQQNEEDNIFAPPNAINDGSPSSSSGYAETRQRRSTDGVLGRVEAQQNKWFQKVHEQRRKIFTDHSMLN